MSDFYYTSAVEEKLILFAVSQDDEEETRSSLDELEELVKTAGGQVLDKMIQNRERIHSVSYFGKGKLEELKERLLELGATGVLCDDELSPVQMRNLEKALDSKVMDRTMLILDIFAARASTSEAKIQVELAQLKYSAARLVGLRSSLSRLGGGIGTRGPGEKKIDMDRRVIHDRISFLKRELKKVEEQRYTRRKSRENSFVIAIVGYTNAGKSSLLNALTNAEVLAEDKLFATLDPTTRKLELAGAKELLITDTVGFIRKLPHNLIEAFKSTLEEARYADLILHVVDASNKHADTHMLVVYDTLKSLGVDDKEIITLFNKSDLLNGDEELLRDFHSQHRLSISVKTGEGMEDLKKLIEQIIRSRRVYIERLYPYKEAAKLALVRKYGEIVEEAYEEEGIRIKAWLDMKYVENC